MIDPQFPHATSNRLAVAQCACSDPVDARGDSGFRGSIFELIKPLLIKIIAVCAEVMSDLIHGANDSVDAIDQYARLNGCAR